MLLTVFFLWSVIIGEL